VAAEWLSVCNRRIALPIRNLNQVQGLLNGAMTQLLPSMKEISREAQSQQERIEALQSRLAAELREIESKVATHEKILGSMLLPGVQASRKVPMPVSG